ncbi:probable RNA-binding protein 46 [Frankliniella occidentalis]|uniref:Probable RNA-binding protein 46 n=1 Tax=Frankliniella occidentalis TaxID=133901 RepID=A0A6J1RXQ2_FRAOC|nr:probable RNA-binding protein 46 [Frankliniella occidentalis]
MPALSMAAAAVSHCHDPAGQAKIDCCQNDGLVSFSVSRGVQETGAVILDAESEGSTPPATLPDQAEDGDEAATDHVVPVGDIDAPRPPKPHHPACRGLPHRYRKVGGGFGWRPSLPHALEAPTMLAPGRARSWSWGGCGLGGYLPVHCMDMSTLLTALPPIGPPPHCMPPQPHIGDHQFETQLRLLDLINKSGYQIEQFNGQRRTGPPSDWMGPSPAPGSEIFIGKIPRDCYEDELFPLLMPHGRLYELRLMMDFSGTNRGFGFAQYANPEEARVAVRALDGYEIRPGKFLGVMKSMDNRRLFIGGLPKEKTREEILAELSKILPGIDIVDVILYPSVVDKTKNRGFAFVEFRTHKDAAIARRKMIPGGVVLWGHELAVDWAEPEPEVPEDVMKTVRVVYMRNLMLSTPESTIRDIIIRVAKVPGSAIEKVKKLKDFAFLHFTERHYAELCLNRLDRYVIDGSTVSLVWAKPPRDRVLHRRNNSSTSEDEVAPRRHVGVGHRRAITSGSTHSLQPPFNSWNTLVAMCGSEPLADVTSWPSPTTPGGLCFLARVGIGCA